LSRRSWGFPLGVTTLDVLSKEARHKRELAENKSGNREIYLGKLFSGFDS